MSDNSYHLLSATEYSTLIYIVSNPHRNPKSTDYSPFRDEKNAKLSDQPKLHSC